MAEPTQTPAWKVGDVVTLKSGGPGMTVVGVAPNGDVAVAWEDRTGASHSAVFPAVCVLKPTLDRAPINESLFLL